MTNQEILNNTEPPVIIDAAHYERLHSMANHFLQRNPDVAERLLEEISRADIRESGEVPATVINLGSKVTYRDDTTQTTQTVYLVWPSDADIEKKQVSVLTPIGAALIGLSEGASIDWVTNGGKTRRLTILKVES